jgi:hypothetical protein
MTGVCFLRYLAYHRYHPSLHQDRTAGQRRSIAERILHRDGSSYTSYLLCHYITKLTLGILLAIRLFAYTPVPVIRWASLGSVLLTHSYFYIVYLDPLHDAVWAGLFLFNTVHMFSNAFSEATGGPSQAGSFACSRLHMFISRTTSSQRRHITINERAGSGGSSWLFAACARRCVVSCISQQLARLLFLIMNLKVSCSQDHPGVG